MKYDYDFFVIGAGSGGTRAARMAATQGIKTAIAEEYRAGGTCVIRGCVPKKLLSYAAQFHDSFGVAKSYGYQVPENIPFSWHELQTNVQTEVTRLENIYKKLLNNAGVEFFADSASLVSDNEIFLKNSAKTITAKKILIATGAKPRPLMVEGRQVGITSDDIFQIKKLPQNLLIYGAGYIAVEFAGILHNLGVDVTLAFRGNKLLKNFDYDLSLKLEEEYTTRGIKILKNIVINDISVDNGAVFIKQNERIYEFDSIFNTIGRIPNTNSLELEKLGIETDPSGSIITDRNFKTNIDSIYAIGDVANKHNLTPVAIQEAMCLTQSLFDTPPLIMDYETIPTAVFSNPEIGTVGLSEQQAMDLGYKLNIFETSFRSMKLTLSDKQTRQYYKLIVDQKTDKVLGVHLFGYDSAELIQVVGIAVKAGLTKKQFDDTMAVHPTASEELVTLRSVSRVV